MFQLGGAYEVLKKRKIFEIKELLLGQFQLEENPIWFLLLWFSSTVFRAYLGFTHFQNQNVMLQ